MSEPRPRAIFFGSPAFAVPCLDAVHALCDVVMVISQPDRPKGRGLALTPPAVKARALELGLPIMQPTKVKTRAFRQTLRDLNADIGVVVAYGRILPQRVLDAPKRGCVNVHGSILPAWRGAAPIQWSVVAGDKETGVTLMQMDAGMDTGDMLSVMTTPIAENETYAELADRLSALGADILTRDLLKVVAGELAPTVQDHDAATHARMLKKTDGEIDWSKSAQEVHDHARGLTPWPGAYTEALGLKTKKRAAIRERLKVHVTRVASSAPHDHAAGEVIARPTMGSDEDDHAIHVACGGGGVLALHELQAAGRKRLSAQHFKTHPGFAPGQRLGALPVDDTNAE